MKKIFKIQRNSIAGCKKPEAEIEIPSEYKLTQIGEKAFSGDSVIKVITIPGNIREILFAAFEGANALERVSFSDAGMVMLKDSAFMKCRKLAHIDNMSIIISYGNKAFMNCEELLDCDINQHIVQFGKSCFEGCKKITKVALPILHKAVPERAFYECESLSDLKISPVLETIGKQAFFGCISLNEVEFVDSLKVVGASAFEDCYSIPKVTFGPNIKKIDKYAFKNCRYLHTVEFAPVGDRAVTIGKGAFSGCAELRTVIIPDGKWSITPTAFDKCNLSSGDPLAIICDDDKTAAAISRKLKKMIKKGMVIVLMEQMLRQPKSKNSQDGDSRVSSSKLNSEDNMSDIFNDE